MPEAKYLVRLRPLEPWFFGSDRTFPHADRQGQRAGGYFIRSLETPAQTTLFGALRYLMLEDKGWPVDSNRIGEKSYSLIAEDQTFGLIHGISPLYLLQGEDSFFIPAPLDHDNTLAYHPFKEYDIYETNHGTRRYPNGYDEKSAFQGGWLCLGCNAIHTDLFESEERVGVAINKCDESFFKKEYKRFKHKDFCFAFFAKLSAKFPQQVVYLGQGRCAFEATCEQVAEPAAICFAHDIAYAQSPVYVQDVQALYDCCEFVCASPVSSRSVATDDGKKRLEVGGELLRLIAPGSVFILRDPKRFKELLQNKQPRTAGFNYVIYKGEYL